MKPTKEHKEAALAFLKAFATEHQYFTGGDVLEAYRASIQPGCDCDWRNVWGHIIKVGEKCEWYVKAGRIAPTTKQSHTESLVQWQSRLYKGEQSLTGVTAKTQLEDIRKQFVLRNIDMKTALWKAYELGVSQKCN